MISPDEIKSLALKWWKPFLESTINGEPYFPRLIDRIGKVQPGHITTRFEVLQKEIETLYQHSKNKTGVGYIIKTEERNFRRTGSHELPQAIVFETTDDYLHVTGKRKEWQLFVRNYEEVVNAIPELQQWCLEHCLWLTKADVRWKDILGVCRYFIDNPRPGLYVRQIPVQVHTKFIEENAQLLQLLLDALIPGHIRDPYQKRFAERYFLQYDQPLIRMRMLDEQLVLAGSLSDISIPISDFAHLESPACNVLITENKMNFLTLPALPSTVAVWSGGGFNVSYLSTIGWLRTKNIYYWGDIDEHGFQILHQLRSYFPEAKSVMMDVETFEHFSEFTVVGPRNRSEQLSFLDTNERLLFNRLKLMEKNRLEQEKISQLYADEYLRGII